MAKIGIGLIMVVELNADRRAGRQVQRDFVVLKLAGANKLTGTH